MRPRLDHTLLYALLLALLVSLPFEPIRPLLSLGFLEVNHLKVLLAAAGVVWTVDLIRNRATARPGVVGWFSALFLAVASLSAVLAPSHQTEATRFVGRLASGLMVLFLARHVVGRRASRVTGLLWAICLGAASSVALGLGEVAGWAALDPLLSLFKIAPTRVGGDLRLSASFQYATIAAMYFELVAPLALVLAVRSGERWQRWAAAGAAALCSIAVALSLSRAGVFALVASLGLVFVVALARPALRRLVLPTALAGASAGLVMGGLSLRLPDFGARFGTENDSGWYAASYAAPASLLIQQGTPAQATVTATNMGQVTWTADGDRAFAMAYRWLSADSTSELEVPVTLLTLPHVVRPGEAVQLTINVDPRVSGRLPPGDYRLAWGMLQENVLWFHDRGFPDAETTVHVAAGAHAEDEAVVAQEPRQDSGAIGPAPVARAELWRAAWEMFTQRPLLGFGPDNFRHLYGAYLGLPTWDERVHANNLYLELLADLGVLGTVAFGLVLAPAIVGVIRGIQTPPSPRPSPSGRGSRLQTAPSPLPSPSGRGTRLQTAPSPRPSPSGRERRNDALLIGFCASLLAFFIHGTLDYFLDFTPVYVLFWLIVGLSSAQSAATEA